jgi:2-(1,2-epoxy-1,2-dihydrophenyl)acetyl-CoA isomerase
MTTEHTDVLYDVSESIATITLNRPERLNALSNDLTAGLAEYIQRATDDAGVRVVIITGAGRGFCSGQDISGPTNLATRDDNPDLPPSVADRRHNLRGIQRVGRAVLQLDKPYLAAVNGPAAGAGMDLASWADIRVAAREAKFTQAYSRNALIPGNGGCYFLPRLVGMATALELLWTSRSFTAEEALQMGYVSRVYDGDKLMDQTRAFARELAAGPPVSISYMKQLAYKSQDVDMDTALNMAQWLQTIAASTLDAREGPAAFREKRPPRFTGR